MAAAALNPFTIPGPPHIPLVGWRAYALLFYRDPIGYMTKVRQAYGNVAAWKAKNPPIVFAFGPEQNRQLLSDQELFFSDPFANLPPSPNLVLQTLRSGLFNMNSDKHKQQRRLMMPAFHKKQVETYRDDMVVLTQRTLDRWYAGQALDVAAEMRRLTMMVGTKTLFGLDVPPNAESIGGLISRMLELLTSTSVNVLPYNLPGTAYREMLGVAERLEATIRQLIDQKRSQGAGSNDVLSMLIQTRDEDGAAMTDMELVAQAFTLFVAGHESSSNALSWTLFLLSQHPRILSELREELAGVLRGAPPTVEQLQKLPLLERVIKESMRLLPPAAFGSRISTAPAKIGSYDVPTQTTLVYSQYLTHRTPDLYPQPERFMPERWERITPSLYEYLPFGAGPRMCIGATFAMMQIKIVLAMMLQRYGLMLAPNTRIDRSVKVTLGSRQGMPMVTLPMTRVVPRIAPHGNIHEMVDLTAAS